MNPVPITSGLVKNEKDISAEINSSKQTIQRLRHKIRTANVIAGLAVLVLIAAIFFFVILFSFFWIGMIVLAFGVAMIIISSSIKKKARIAIIAEEVKLETLNKMNQSNLEFGKPGILPVPATLPNEIPDIYNQKTTIPTVRPEQYPAPVYPQIPPAPVYNMPPVFIDAPVYVPTEENVVKVQNASLSPAYGTSDSTRLITTYERNMPLQAPTVIDTL